MVDSTYPSHHLRCQGPCGTGRRTLGPALHPDVMVFVAIARVAVPVATSVVGHIGLKGERLCR